MLQEAPDGVESASDAGEVHLQYSAGAGSFQVWWRSFRALQPRSGRATDVLSRGPGGLPDGCGSPLPVGPTR